MFESLEFSTRSIPQGQRFQRFRDFYIPGSDAVDLGQPIAAEVHAWRLDGLIAFERRLVGIGGERAAPRVRRNAFDHFTLQLNLRGEFHGEGSEGFCAVRPGELLLLDMTKPMRSRMPDTHLITLALSRLAIESASSRVDRLHGLVIPQAVGVALAGYLCALPQRIEVQSPTGEPEEITAITELLRSALSEMGLGRPAPAMDSDVRLAAARRFIQHNLTADDLTPVRVARATNMSRATLYRVFEPLGGVGKYIQTQRLIRLRESLSDPFTRSPVSALAHDAGFASEHHANRSFRQTFGLPPAEFRREVRTLAERRHGLPTSASEGQMLSWYLTLGQQAPFGLQGLRSAA